MGLLDNWRDNGMDGTISDHHLVGRKRNSLNLTENVWELVLLSLLMSISVFEAEDHRSLSTWDGLRTELCVESAIDLLFLNLISESMLWLRSLTAFESNMCCASLVVTAISAAHVMVVRVRTHRWSQVCNKCFQFLYQWEFD